MKFETNFLPAKPPDTGGIGERLLTDVRVAHDLLNRASKATARAQHSIGEGKNSVAAEASGQAMMLARRAEMILMCAISAERAALTALAEQPQQQTEPPKEAT
jgi:HEPN domain-containing protein